MKLNVVNQKKIVVELVKGYSFRQIAKNLHVSPSTVSILATKLKEVSIPVNELLLLTNEEFIDVLQTRTSKNIENCKSLPEFDYINDQMKIRDMTLKQLWIEFKERVKNCVSYSRFAYLYRRWLKKLHPCLRQNFTAGQTLLVDFCGKTMPIHDINSGKVRNVQIFVGVLGASSLITVIAVETQQTCDWLKCFTATFDRIGGVPREVITDNLKAAVIRTGRNGTVLNKTFEQFADYHDFAILNTRPRNPKDKGLAEVCVQIVQRSILVKLRGRKFFSLEDLQKALDIEVDKINEGVTRRFSESRMDRFLRFEKSELLPQPQHPYPFRKWIFQKTVSEFYQFTIFGNIYSVPYHFIGKKIDIGITDKEAQFFYENELITSHTLLKGNGETSIIEEHMPKNHRLYNSLSPASIKNWAETLGQNAYMFVEKILSKSKNLARNIHSLNKLRDYIFEKQIESELNEACGYALRHDLLSVTDLIYILRNKRYVSIQTDVSQPLVLVAHNNLRGAEYFGENV
ncbi:MULTISPECIES: IS21 family transposase [Acinetobacter]|uniref:IS21 family transposase n=2 Tax=Moraxellaceae TaxID=468 RepID=UPI00112EC421|nr:MULTISPECIES: IS21 family transposase [Acinetobacter]TPS25786.1 IS21 family transposase [Acinetobacter baumannii]